AGRGAASGRAEWGSGRADARALALDLTVHAEQSLDDSCEKSRRPCRRLFLRVALGSACGKLRVGERDKRLELVAARFAFPKMPHPVPIQILGPFRQEDRLTALGTE